MLAVNRVLLGPPLAHGAVDEAHADGRRLVVKAVAAAVSLYAGGVGMAGLLLVVMECTCRGHRAGH